MATCLVTPRDIDLFHALERSPLTVRQLLKLSMTFAHSFTTERRVQERLQRLCAAGRLRRWLYATAGQGALSYYTLTREAFQLLHGPEAPSASRGILGPVGVARQRHTYALAEFLVHLLVCADRGQIEVGNFHRENALGLRTADEVLFPDGAFELTSRDRGRYRFFVEIDNCTESIRTSSSLDTWQRKITFYERYQDAHPDRFRVLAVTTGGQQRLRNILECAKDLARNPRRSLVYGITLANFLANAEALTIPCFFDHQARRVSLTPLLHAHYSQTRSAQSASAGLPRIAVVRSVPCLEPLPQA